MITLTTVTVGQAGLFGLNLKVEKLNRRAKRHGMNKLVVKILREYTIDDELTGYQFPQYDIEIEGSAPCINGWYLAARIENNDLIGITVHVVPSKFAEEDYSEYRTHDFSCDHCNTKRRRNDVFVIKNDEGFTRVIGRNCLADYIRTEDAGAFARYAEFCDECALFDNGYLSEAAYDEGFGGGSNYPVISIQSFLSVVAVCTRRLGWTSRGAAYNTELTASADLAYYVLFGYGKSHERFIKDNKLFENENDTALAGRAVEWASNLDGKSEYLDTIQRIAKAGVTDHKLSGYAASIIRAYQKDCEWEEKRAKKREKVYIGEVKSGQQDLGRVRVVRVRYYEGNFGTKTIVAMEADLPNGVAPITWFASGSLEFEEGEEYTLRAGVKEHKEDDRWGKQTVVTRAKLTGSKV